MRRLAFLVCAALLLAAFPLTCHYAPRLAEAALGPPAPPPDPFVEEMEALAREWEGRSGAIPEGAKPAAQERRKRRAEEIYRKHGRVPPWLAK
jgi:hypothetical protein